MTKKISFSLIIVFIIAVMAVFGYQKLSTNNSYYVEVKDTIPSQEIVTMDGEKISLPMFQGKTIMLNFWATWCAPCRAEIPDMLNLAREHEDKMVLIFVSSDKSPETVNKYLDSFKKSSIQNSKNINADNVYWVLDKELKLFTKMSKSHLIPTTFIISKQQKIVKKIVGRFDWASNDIREKMYIIVNSK